MEGEAMMQYEKAAYQDPKELQVFIKLIQSENVRSYLEIGSAHGGSLWRIALSLPEGSRIVSVDLPSKMQARSNLEHCCDTLRKKNRDVHLILGDSADPSVVKKVSALGPYDLCLIDGNHSEKYVQSDWQTYGPMARIVAFHDINDHKLNDRRVQVPMIWAQISRHYRHQEIKLRDEPVSGIGVIWRS